MMVCNSAPQENQPDKSRSSFLNCSMKRAENRAVQIMWQVDANTTKLYQLSKSNVREYGDVVKCSNKPKTLE